MTGKTTTDVHSAEQMSLQRWRALARDRCALCGLSVFTQIFIGMAFYLYDHVSTPGYLSILLTIPFALVLMLLARGTALKAGEQAEVISFAAGKRGTKPVLFFFLVLHLFNAQLIFVSLCAMLLDTMPDHSLWKMALLIALALALANSGRQEEALTRLARFLKWIIFALLLYAVLASAPHGRAAHFFPVFGYGWKSIANGALWMCGAVSGCVWPWLAPQNKQALSPLLAKRHIIIKPILLSILAGCAMMMVSVWLMPLYAMARDETLGWRLLLLTNMTPSIPAWSMETVGLLLLFFLALSDSANQVSILTARLAGKRDASGWITLLILLLLLPMAVIQDGFLLNRLTRWAFWRGPATLIVLLFLRIGSAIHNSKKENSV